VDTPEKRFDIDHKGSSSHNPDLDWSQIKETITMLALAVAQVQSTLTDGNQSINTLTESFTRMAGSLESIKNSTEKVTPENIETFKQDIAVTTGDLESDIQGAVVAFQFHDRTTQRLDHVCKNLDRLGVLISSPESLYNPEHWKAFQDQIKGSYSMESERIMFEHILQGQSIEQALQIYRHHFEESEKEDKDGTNDEIEFF
jgi:hypothetical protein